MGFLASPIQAGRKGRWEADGRLLLPHQGQDHDSRAPTNGRHQPSRHHVACEAWKHGGSEGTRGSQSRWCSHRNGTGGTRREAGLDLLCWRGTALPTAACRSALPELRGCGQNGNGTREILGTEGFSHVKGQSSSLWS